MSVIDFEAPPPGRGLNVLEGTLFSQVVYIR